LPSTPMVERAKSNMKYFLVSMKTKINSLSKSKHLVMCVLAMIIFLASCTTIAPNIKSVDDIKGHKLLVGRFIFYVNGKLIEPHERRKEFLKLTPTRKARKKTKTEEDKEIIVGFTIFLQNGETKRVVLDENGYVYILVDEGHYYINRVKHHSAFLGTHRFSPNPNTGFKIRHSDAVVNFGTIKVDFRQSTASKAVGILTLIASQGFFTASSAQLYLTQSVDWDTPRNYISSKFNIPPELIRDEVVRFIQNPLTFFNDKLATRNIEDSHFASDWYSKGLDELRAGNYSTAVTHMSKVIKIVKDISDVYYYRGLAYGELKQYEKAVKDYSKSVELDRENVSAYLCLIEVSIMAGNYKDAIDVITKTLPLQSTIGERIILLYLECVAKKLLNKDTNTCEEELDGILKNGIIFWSFHLFESWLKGANIDDDTRSYIEEKTRLVKKHQSGAKIRESLKNFLY